LVGFGKHAGLTFAEVATEHPEYRAWVLEAAAKARHGKKSAALLELASYLEASVGPTPWEDMADVNAGPIDPVNLTPEQRAAVDRAFTGENLFLTGAAGTGKSFLLRYLIQELEKRHPQGVAVTASTGIAAANIGGQTLHSFAGIGLGWGGVPRLMAQIEKNPQALERWQKTKVLIVDEVSMLHGSLFAKLEEIARRIRKKPTLPFGGLQLLFCGDFLQLPPVPDQQDEERVFCFQTEAWKKCGLNDGVVLLQEAIRQAGDPGFADILNEVRVGKVSAETQKVFEACRIGVKAPPPEDGIVPTKLYCFNKAVDKENNAQLNELPGKAVVLKADDSWIAEPSDESAKTNLVDTLNKRVPKQLKLKVGAQVILIKNRSDLGLVNGSRGTVIAFRFNYPLVRFDNGVLIRVREETFEMRGAGGAKLTRSQVPLKLGWALTVHRAQGLTLSRAELEVNQAFEVGQTYVALSRLTGTDGLWISGQGISKSRTRADPEALKFYEDAAEGRLPGSA